MLKDISENVYCSFYLNHNDNRQEYQKSENSSSSLGPAVYHSCDPGQAISFLHLPSAVICYHYNDVITSAFISYHLLSIKRQREKMETSYLFNGLKTKM